MGFLGDSLDGYEIQKHEHSDGDHSPPSPQISCDSPHHQNSSQTRQKPTENSKRTAPHNTNTNKSNSLLLDSNKNHIDVEKRPQETSNNHGDDAKNQPSSRAIDRPTTTTNSNSSAECFH